VKLVGHLHEDPIGMSLNHVGRDGDDARVAISERLREKGSGQRAQFRVTRDSGEGRFAHTQVGTTCEIHPRLALCAGERNPVQRFEARPLPYFAVGNVTVGQHVGIPRPAREPFRGCATHDARRSQIVRGLAYAWVNTSGDPDGLLHGMRLLVVQRAQGCGQDGHLSASWLGSSFPWHATDQGDYRAAQSLLTRRTQPSKRLNALYPLREAYLVRDNDLSQLS
jgi:hypothetical protein